MAGILEIICLDSEYADQVTLNLKELRAPKGPVRFKEDLLSGLVENYASRVRIEALQDDREFAKSKYWLVEIIIDWLLKGKMDI